MIRGRHLTTLHLLLIAFGLAALVAVSAAAGIYQAGRQVHRQTRQIMENGLPSLLVAVRLQAILPELAPDRLANGSLQPIPRHDFDEAVSRFRSQLTVEDRRQLSFAGEEVLIDQMIAELTRLEGLDDALRRQIPASQAAVASYRQALARLQTTCDRFHRLNDQGMTRSRAMLTRTADDEEARVIQALVGILLLWSLSAVVLVWSIAKPLAGLTEQVRELPQSGTLPFQRLSPWTPLEIRRLWETFSRTAATLSHEISARRQAQTELEAALEREYGLSAHLAQSNASLDEQVRRQTAELAAAVTALQEKDRAKSAFLAAVSHELRAPLAVISSASRTVVDLGSRLPPAAMARLMTSVVSEADHLSALLSDLLDVARLDVGVFRLAPEPDVDAVALLEGLAGSLVDLFAERAVRLDLHLTTVPLIVADPERLRQVLRNLLENAAKYAPSGSTVRVSLQVRRDEATGDRLAVFVDDDGPGVPVERRQRLFVAFERGDLYHLDSGGAGLGLSVARQLVEAHGGAIDVADAPGGGCRFWFWLPIGGPVTVRHDLTTG